MSEHALTLFDVPMMVKNHVKENFLKHKNESISGLGFEPTTPTGLGFEAIASIGLRFVSSSGLVSNLGSV